LQASEAMPVKAISPEDNGSAITSEFIGDLHVGRLIGTGKPQEETATKDEGLRRGMRAGEGFELSAFIEGEHDHRSKGSRHGGHPCREKTMGKANCQGPITAPDYPAQSDLSSDL
jgi:hypothetical protein